jgi:hypothetical protein
MSFSYFYERNLVLGGFSGAYKIPPIPPFRKGGNKNSFQLISEIMQLVPVAERVQ